MPAKIFSVAINGLKSQIVEVEVDISFGLRSFNIVGLPDKAVKESKERVSAAINSIHLKPPHHQPQQVLVNLAPADIKKEGSLYDLPIALGYLSASDQVKFSPEHKIFVGELSLGGQLKPVRGAISFALAAKQHYGINTKGFGQHLEIILPKVNAKEAALIKGMRVVGVESLKQAIDYLEGRENIVPTKVAIESFLNQPDYPLDLGWIKGQESAKRALEIAAAGGHNILMVGPPGTGKTLLAKAIPSLLPPLSPQEALEVTTIYSIAGLLPEDKPLISCRPFRAPHHSSSRSALLGGGTPPRPGEITLAHRGILFLDEFPEFHRDVLEGLREPIEEGKVTILRANYNQTLPAKFTLVAAANPSPGGGKETTFYSHHSQVARYQRRLSGPLVDRIDLRIEVPAVKYEKLISKEDAGLSGRIRARVKCARDIQLRRFSLDPNTKKKILTNSEMGLPQIKKFCQIDRKSQELLRNYVNSGRLTARGYHRVLKIARTIADLSSSENISYADVAEALMYRVRENNE